MDKLDSRALPTVWILSCVKNNYKVFKVVLILLHLLLSSCYKRAGGGGDMKFDMLGMDIRGVKKPGNHSKHVPSLSKLLSSPSDHNPMPICPSNVQLRKMCTISYVKGFLVPPFEFVGQKTI